MRFETFTAAIRIKRSKRPKRGRVNRLDGPKKDKKDIEDVKSVNEKAEVGMEVTKFHLGLDTIAIQRKAQEVVLNRRANSVISGIDGVTF